LVVGLQKLLLFVFLSADRFLYHHCLLKRLTMDFALDILKQHHFNITRLAFLISTVLLNLTQNAVDLNSEPSLVSNLCLIPPPSAATTNNTSRRNRPERKISHPQIFYLNK
jgi:hypothetical protein